MTTSSKEELTTIAENDDLHIAPFREDGTTYGTRLGSSRCGRRFTLLRHASPLMTMGTYAKAVTADKRMAQENIAA